MAPENARERRFLYETDPTFGMVMDTLCRMAVEDDNDRINVALDFFLYGIAVVTADDGGITLFDPAMCRRADGGVRVKPANMDEIFVPAAVLEVEGDHPAPCVEFGMLRNTDPWLREWERAETQLDAWIASR
jgi:hypothetical protein